MLPSTLYIMKIYLGTAFEVATSTGLGTDTFTRNVTQGQTEGRTMDRFWYKINIPFFLKKTADITSLILCRISIF